MSISEISLQSTEGFFPLVCFPSEISRKWLVNDAVLKQHLNVVNIYNICTTKISPFRLWSQACFSVVHTGKMLQVPCYQHSNINSWVYYLDFRQCSWKVHMFHVTSAMPIAVESESRTLYKLIVNLYKEGTIFKTCVYSIRTEKGESLSYCHQFLYNTTGLNYLNLK